MSKLYTEFSFDPYPSA